MNMVASLLRLDRSAIQALRITDPYSLHRVVYGLYEDVRNDTTKGGSLTSGILYADKGGDIRSRNVLLLANRPPQSEVDGYSVDIKSKIVPDVFLDQDAYRFHVVVNPTRRDNQSRKLVPVKGRDNIIAWFCERAGQSWGFCAEADHVQVDRIQVQRFRDKHRNLVTMAQAHVQGILAVDDRSQFIKSFQQGIGRGRAFGCGLLQVTPLNSFN